jgi:hypothetical protein
MQVKGAWAWAAFFVAVMWGAVIVATGPLLARLWELRQAAATTSGVVTTVDPRDHDRATYRYRVNGTEYTNSEVASFHRKGETVTVYYSPRRPWVCALTEPEPAFRENLKGTLFLCGLIAVVATVAALRAR